MNVKKISYLFLLPALLIGCSNKASSHSDHPRGTVFGEWEIQDTEFYSMKDENYMVLVYSRYCVACEHLKPFVDNYHMAAESRNATSVYTLDVADNEELKFVENDSLVTTQKGNTDIYETYFYQTPSLYEIKNKSLENVVVDYNAIKEYLTEGII